MSTIITSMSVITLRWIPPRICWEGYVQIPSFVDFLPKHIFDERLSQIERLVREKCPSTHVEYYIFVFIIACIVCSAGFSLAARSANISMWYPLILLIVPAALSFWTSRRRSTYVHRIKEFEQALKQMLKDFNKMDRVRWSFRRPSANDTLPIKYKRARLCLVIQISSYSEELPSYQTAVMSNIALDNSFHQPLPPPSYSQIDCPTAASSIAGSSRTPTLLLDSADSSRSSVYLTQPEQALVRQQHPSMVLITPVRADTTDPPCH
ncbi:hypothetical protein BX666DRAFT_2120977 [Dichotomocladium elegans]|nr:hypothetical protein BX666DRAFT_2120977 [Dichotomocladium elegans]